MEDSQQNPIRELFLGEFDERVDETCRQLLELKNEPKAVENLTDKEKLQLVIESVGLTYEAYAMPDFIALEKGYSEEQRQKLHAEKPPWVSPVVREENGDINWSILDNIARQSIEISKQSLAENAHKNKNHSEHEYHKDIVTSTRKIVESVYFAEAYVKDREDEKPTMWDAKDFQMGLEKGKNDRAIGNNNPQFTRVKNLINDLISEKYPTNETELRELIDDCNNEICQIRELFGSTKLNETQAKFIMDLIHRNNTAPELDLMMLQMGQRFVNRLGDMGADIDFYYELMGCSYTEEQLSVTQQRHASEMKNQIVKEFGESETPRTLFDISQLNAEVNPEKKTGEEKIQEARQMVKNIFPDLNESIIKHLDIEHPIYSADYINWTIYYHSGKDSPIPLEFLVVPIKAYTTIRLAANLAHEAGHLHHIKTLGQSGYQLYEKNQKELFARIYEKSILKVGEGNKQGKFTDQLRKLSLGLANHCLWKIIEDINFESINENYYTEQLKPLIDSFLLTAHTDTYAGSGVSKPPKLISVFDNLSFPGDGLFYVTWGAAKKNTAKKAAISEPFGADKAIEIIEMKITNNEIEQKDVETILTEMIKHLDQTGNQNNLDEWESFIRNYNPKND